MFSLTPKYGLVKMLLYRQESTLQFASGNNRKRNPSLPSIDEVFDHDMPSTGRWSYSAKSDLGMTMISMFIVW